MYRRIRNLREDRDLKQQDLAKLLNCTQACYSNYENGKREPSLGLLVRMSDYFNVSIDYLLGRSNDPTFHP